MNEERQKVISVAVPPEVWGNLVADALQHKALRTNRTRSDLAKSAVAFVLAGLERGGALETDASFAARAKAREAAEAGETTHDCGPDCDVHRAGLAAAPGGVEL